MTTLTTEISSIQIKLLFLHFKSIKINEDIVRINGTLDLDPATSESIKKKGEIAFDIVEIVALFESYNSLICDIFKFDIVSSHLTPDMRVVLGNVQKATSKWKHVRNKIGGHLDIDPIQEFCVEYNYQGVFISNNLEADFKGVLVLQMIESAINVSLSNSKLFDSKLTLTNPADLDRLIESLNADWKLCLDLFHSLSKFLYGIGKQEKLRSITPKDIGIIKFE